MTTITVSAKAIAADCASIESAVFLSKARSSGDATCATSLDLPKLNVRLRKLAKNF